MPCGSNHPLRPAAVPPACRCANEGSVTSTQIAVTALGAVAIVWVLWYFLFSRGTAVAATARASGVQEVHVTVKGGYTPDTIVVQAGKPVRLQFYPDETADCSERVVFEHSGIDQLLPAFQTTAIEYDAAQTNVGQLIKTVREAGYNSGKATVTFGIVDLHYASSVAPLEQSLSRVNGVIRAVANQATETSTVDYIPGVVTAEDLEK